MKTGIADAVGKTIVGAIYSRNTRQPHEQLFLEFSDGTYLEFYGDSFTCAAGVDPGGEAEIRQYASNFKGEVKRLA